MEVRYDVRRSLLTVTQAAVTSREKRNLCLINITQDHYYSPITLFHHRFLILSGTVDRKESESSRHRYVHISDGFD